MKQIQIPESLFYNLCDYFLWEAPDYSNVEDFTQAEMEKLHYENLNEEISRELQEKVDKILDRMVFSEYKTASTPELREQARQKYLNRKGIPRLYRTEKEVKMYDYESRECETQNKHQTRIEKAVEQLIYGNENNQTNSR